MLTCSPWISSKYKRCGNTIDFTLHSGLRTTFGMDKTIAPHPMVYINLTKYKVCIYQVWVLLLSSSFQYQSCEV